MERTGDPATLDQGEDDLLANRADVLGPGDVAGVYANPDRALELIGWKVKHTIDEGIATSLEWGKRRKDMLGY